MRILISTNAKNYPTNWQMQAKKQFRLGLFGLLILLFETPEDLFPKALSLKLYQLSFRQNLAGGHLQMLIFV